MAINTYSVLAQYYSCIAKKYLRRCSAKKTITMFSWISSKLLGFLPIKGWIITAFLILAGAAAGSGWLLLNAHQEIGRQETEVIRQKDLVQQWQSANEHWAVAWGNREVEIEDAQQRLINREQAYSDINSDLSERYKQVRKIKDENNILDSDLGNDFWLHINKSVEAGNATDKLPDS